MSDDALILAASALLAMLGLSIRAADPPSIGSWLDDAGATGTLGDDPVTVAVLCGGLHL